MPIHNVFLNKRLEYIISIQGKEYKVYKAKYNELNEELPVDFEQECDLKIKGIFSEPTSPYRGRMYSEDARAVSKYNPVFLCLWKDVCGMININDIFIRNGHKYKVVSIDNMQEENIVCQISFEENDNGWNC